MNEPSISAIKLENRELNSPVKTPSGDQAREAVASLRGYVYQIYQTALAWTELKSDEFLFLEVAEDFVLAASQALEAVQVKDTAAHVTINSDDIIASIDSFVEIQERNPNQKVTLRHLTTSTIGKEQKVAHRIGDLPTLVAWRNLAKAGELAELRKILSGSKLSPKTKAFIENLDDSNLRESFLKKIHFDCGALEIQFLERQLNSTISALVIERGGVHSQAQGCTAEIVLSLLNLAINKNRDERFVGRSGLEELLEKATQITVSRAQFETQNLLVTKALSGTINSDTGLSSSRITTPSAVSGVPLPSALATRKKDLGVLQKSLETSGICWVSGASGMGKTIAARVLARNNEGDWASVNLRGQTEIQVATVLMEAAGAISGSGLRGLIVDDLDCALGPSVLDNLNYLFHAAFRSDVLLTITASNPPSADFLFSASLHKSILTNLNEFCEEDIKEILSKIEVSHKTWAKYVHLVSGGGHPQLAIAFIQSMAASGWPVKELQTLNSLIVGSSAIDDVRKRTRQRLLDDLPASSRQLLERLSLKVGGFSRELVLDVAKVAPPISDPGVVLDSLCGSWIDQDESDRFNLSPLLLDYANKTLSSDEQKAIQYSVAGSLTKGNRFDVTDMNSALIAAWTSGNKAAMFKLCMAVLNSNEDELEMLAPYLSMFTLFRTDVSAYPDDASISQMFRGVQVLLINRQDDSSIKLKNALDCFEREAENVAHSAPRAAMRLVVYSKLLLAMSNSQLGTHFVGVIGKMNKILENKESEVPSEILEDILKFEDRGVTTIGFMFLNQCRQLIKIADLSLVFEYLNASPTKLRETLLAPFGHKDFDVDMLVTGAWLHEHKADSIEPEVHSAIFADLEKLAVNWKHTNLAVCCRKYQAIILDEYGGKKERALDVINTGLDLYGRTNSELVRAKAKILYHSDEHEESLALSKKLIESDAPLSDVEKAFLGRDAAISAEKQGDMEAARQYYLYGSKAAGQTDLPDMITMRIGLLADAALASWHYGDRKTCLLDLAAVLTELGQLEPKQNVQTAHCHAMCRHVLLWLDQNVTGDQRLLDNDEETRIYPGCLSNPEPHPAMIDRYIPPIELAWYMLAKVENHAGLNAGITDGLDRFLPEGPVVEGQLLLAFSKMHKGLLNLDQKVFSEALQDTIANRSYVLAKGGHENVFDVENVTFAKIPRATKPQHVQHADSAEQFVLLFCVNCVLYDEVAQMGSVIEELNRSSGYTLRPKFLDRLQSFGPTPDFNTSFANIIFLESSSLKTDQKATPRHVFEFSLKTLQVAHLTGNYRLFAELILPWLKHKWQFVWERQRFLLVNPSLNERSIEAALQLTSLSAPVEILKTTAPTLGFGNLDELNEILSEFPSL